MTGFYVDARAQDTLPRAEDSVPPYRWFAKAIALLLADTDSTVRAEAFEALFRLEWRDRSILQHKEINLALARSLSLKDPLTDSRALPRLARAGVKNPAVEQRMLEIMEGAPRGQRDMDARAAALQYLWKAGDPLMAVEALREDLAAFVMRPDPNFNFLNARGIVEDVSGWLQDHAREMSYAELGRQIEAADTVLAFPDSLWGTEGRGGWNRDELQRSRSHLAEVRGSKRFEVVLTHWKLLLPIAYVATVLLLWSLILWLRPLWLLRINEAIRTSYKVTLPAWLGGFTLSLQDVTLLRFFHYRPRVLDAWVNAALRGGRARFTRRPLVAERSAYVPMPVVLDGDSLPAITASSLRHVFSQQRFSLLIHGEGGAGKTALALQVAHWAMSDQPEERPTRHRMIPVVLESELPDIQNMSPLLAAVGAQLRDLAGSQAELHSGLVEVLLRTQRVLLIVDHLSEMSPRNRALVWPNQHGFPANAFIVTSRSEEPLQVDHSVITPIRLRPGRVGSFMEAFLTRLKKRELFTDTEFSEVCESLSDLGGDRAITPLLATMYARLRVAAKEGRFDDNLPTSIPDLMLAYLNSINAGVTEEAKVDRVVHRDAKRAAWGVIGATLTPAAARREDVLAALSDEDAESRLDYLERRLRIVETVGVTREEVRFTLDPIAEYLAAIQFIETHVNAASQWQVLLTRLEHAGASGFLTALLECCALPRLRRLVPAELDHRIDQLRMGLTLARQSDSKSAPTTTLTSA